MREDDVDQGSDSKGGKEWLGSHLLSISICRVREGEEKKDDAIFSPQTTKRMESLLTFNRNTSERTPQVG